MFSWAASSKRPQWCCWWGCGSAWQRTQWSPETHNLSTLITATSEIRLWLKMLINKYYHDAKANGSGYCDLGEFFPVWFCAPALIKLILINKKQGRTWICLCYLLINLTESLANCLRGSKCCWIWSMVVLDQSGRKRFLMQGGLISRSLRNEQLQLTTPLLDSGARDKAFCTEETLQGRTGHRFSSDVLWQCADVQQLDRRASRRRGKGNGQPVPSAASSSSSSENTQLDGWAG